MTKSLPSHGFLTQRTNIFSQAIDNYSYMWFNIACISGLVLLNKNARILRLQESIFL